LGKQLSARKREMKSLCREKGQLTAMWEKQRVCVEDV
jgi:hypothetical protein